jgi:hypothetical protein
LWIEEDYLLFTTFGLEAVLDRYFDGITVEKVKSEKEGWKMICNKPQLWRK